MILLCYDALVDTSPREVEPRREADEDIAQVLAARNLALLGPDLRAGEDLRDNVSEGNDQRPKTREVGVGLRRFVEEKLV